MRNARRLNAPEAPHGRRPGWGVVLLLLVAGGCGENRISLREFLARQQEQVEQAQREVKPLPAADVELIDEALGPYRVGPGDVLRISVTGVEQEIQPLPLEARIDSAGVVRIPGAGEVQVADLTIEEAESKLHDAYVPNLYREAAVHVTLGDVDTTDVLVVGAVGSAGLVHLKRTERDLLHAIVAAGGVSELASGEVQLERLRYPDQTARFSMTDPAGIQAALGQDPLQTGDIVTVMAARPNMVYVGGLVNAPSPQTLPPGVPMTILQALAGSGGLRTDVTPREATLIRPNLDGTDTHVKLDLDRITTGRDPNIVLAPGDILWVPDTLETRVQDWINKNIFVRAGVSATATYNANGIEYLNRRSQQSAHYGGSSTEDLFDPFGFIRRGQALQTLTPR